MVGCGMIFVLSIAFYIAGSAEAHKLHKRDHSNDFSPLKMMVSHVLWVLQMGEDPNMLSYAGRILYMAAQFFAFMIWTYYTCDLTANMTAGPPPFAIRYMFNFITYNNNEPHQVI